MKITIENAQGVAMSLTLDLSGAGYNQSNGVVSLSFGESGAMDLRFNSDQVEQGTPLNILRMALDELCEK